MVLTIVYRIRDCLVCGLGLRSTGNKR